MEKIFTEYNVIRDNSLLLANRIYKDGFVPDVIYVLLRGGAYIGNILSEFYKVKLDGKKPVYYAAVSAKSYTGFSNDSKVRIEGWTYNPKHLRDGDKILIVDDIFDSGNTINFITKEIMSKGIVRENIKVVVYDYKVKINDAKQQIHPITPDYYCRKHIISDEDIWIHYLSHELIGLTDTEKQEYYIKNNLDLKSVL